MGLTGNTQRQHLKAVYFVLEGLNSFATVQYLYYFYFFTQKEFGFGAKANLAAAALNGGLTAIGSFFGGKFAQRHGYHRALKLGFFIMMTSLAIGSQLSSPALPPRRDERHGPGHVPDLADARSSCQ
jgi:predicted MFS family arabinose efflux permease